MPHHYAVRSYPAAALAVFLFAGTASAATFTVTKTADTSDGTCDADCSLREAINAANAAAGPDTVDVPAGTYVRTIAGSAEDAGATGDLDVLEEMSLTGAGADATIIDANGLDRVFHLGAAASFSGVTIQNGATSESGGGIHKDGAAALVMVTDCVIRANHANQTGGGLALMTGQLVMANTIVRDNTAIGNGGGVLIDSTADADIDASTISGNEAGDGGGGIHTDSGDFTLLSSTVSGNRSVDTGAIAAVGAGSNVVIESSTISTNWGGAFGGILCDGTTMSLTNVTVAGNVSQDPGIDHTGLSASNGGAITLQNTIVQETLKSACGVSLGGTLASLGNNLASDATCNLTQPADLPSTSPDLGPLQDNGGPTFTRALLSASAAIDAGNDSACAPFDQRGTTRVDGDGDTVVTCDIGAYEHLPALDRLDHFLCYRAKGSRDISVTLSDPLDAGAYVGKSLKVFCNPADKNGEGIADTATHLTSYRVKGPHLRRTALHLTNQFGSYVYDTKKVDTLLAPASKSLLPDPPPDEPSATLVDHYRCLKAATSKGTQKFSPVVVTVEDQFGTRQMEVTKPSKICVATDKNGEGVNRPDSHLVCYKAKPSPATAHPGIQATDQFGTLAFDVKKEVELCVPSMFTQPACPSSLGMSVVAGTGLSTSATKADTGWTAHAHGRDLPEGYELPIDITCTGAEPPCGVCTLDGVSGKAGRCTNDATVACDAIDATDLDDCGGSICAMNLFPPVPLVAGNNPACQLWRLTADVTGSAHNESGAMSLVADVRVSLYAGGGGSSFQHPCPVCVNDFSPNDGVREGACAGGARDGLACDANGSDATFGETSFDCLPDGALLAQFERRLDFTTGLVALPFANACDAPVEFLACACGVCSGDTSIACRDDAECAGAGAGSCTSFGSGVPRLPNECADLVAGCVAIGEAEGHCYESTDVQKFCDGHVRANGSGIVACSSNADCSATECDVSTPGADGCGSCTILEQKPCFLDPILAKGTPAVSEPVLVDIGCVAPTVSAAVNGVLGLPGPDRIRLQMAVSRYE